MSDKGIGMASVNEFFLFLLSLPVAKKIDIVTAIFDIIFVYNGFVNIMKLYRDKDVRGVSLSYWMLCIAWNAWSTFVVYPTANLLMAQYLCGVLMLQYTAWLAMAFYYRQRSKHDQTEKPA